MDDETFLKAFENCTLPFAEWKHRAHLKVAYLYLQRYPFAVAREKVQAGIRAYNSANKVPEGLDRGYHDTVTCAWVMLVNVAVCEYGAAETADSFLDQHPELGEKKTLRLFYSRDLIMSSRAKAEFVEPDLTPLPRSQKSNA